MTQLASSLLAPQTISDVAASIHTTKTLPPAFILPETDRPTVAHDELLPEFQLPVFDLSAFLSSHDQKERLAMLQQLSAACREWGFFRLVNHGISLELLRKLESLGRGFFELPANVKAEALGYRGGFEYSGPHQRWVEAVNLRTPITESNAEFIAKAWPEGNQASSAREFLEEYANAMAEVAQITLQILTEGLGIDSKTFIRHFDTPGAAIIRCNYYPPCPQPSMTLGLGAHTDPGVLTFLYQDAVGGLQILGADGNWRAVKPKTGGLVVNVGDTLKVWSNCMYPSAEHRAVLNGTKARLSVAYFSQPRPETVVESAMELVNEEHPLYYKKPFKYMDYMRARPSLTGPRTLELFLGMPIP